MNIKPGWRSCRMRNPAVIASLIVGGKWASGLGVRLRFDVPCTTCGRYHEEVRLDSGWIKEN